MLMDDPWGITNTEVGMTADVPHNAFVLDLGNDLPQDKIDVDIEQQSGEDATLLNS